MSDQPLITEDIYSPDYRPLGYCEKNDFILES